MDNPDQLTHTAAQSIQGRINNETGRVNEASDKMVAAMSDFLKEFAEFGQTLLAGRAYAASFLAVQRRIEDEDLPRHRERFEHYLNENLVGDLFMLNGRLNEHAQAIESRVKELRQQDDSEADFFAATTGKSGGQKAKLAFTILASALTAQYGLSQSQPDSSNFRLVVIDEAFSRTDEQNPQRAMQLFQSLGFQVVIVGPFDAKAKLAVPFVKTIHLASNATGDKSQMLAITRQELESAISNASPRTRF